MAYIQDKHIIFHSLCNDCESERKCDKNNRYKPWLSWAHRIWLSLEGCHLSDQEKLGSCLPF